MTSNPYFPPQSDLTSESIQSGKAPGVWWKVYFFLLIPLTLLGYVISFALGDKSDYAKNIIDFSLFLASTIGVGGYIFGKKILHPKLWRYFFYFYMAYLVIFIAVWIFETPNTSEHHEFLISILAMSGGFAVVAPAYIALYRYGSLNEPPWRNEST